MEPVEMLGDMVLVFAVAAAVVYVFQYLRQPAIVGLLVTGVMIGPSGLSLVQDVERVQILAEVGVVVLLFAVGLEFSLSRLWGMAPMMLRIGAPQVLVCGFVGLMATLWYFNKLGPAILVGMLVAMSSTAVVLKVLTDRGELNSPHGRVALAVLLLQDLMVVLFMVLTPILAGEQDKDNPLWRTLLQSGLVVLGILLAARFVVPTLIHQVVRTRNRELFLLVVVVLCLGTAALTAWVGLSLALGAFLAGLALAESEYAHQTLAEVLPFRDTLASLFFISVGMLLDVRFVYNHAFLVLLTVVGLLILKFFAAALPTLWMGYPLRVSILAGAALAQVGEFSFLLAQRGVSLKLLSVDEYQTFLAAAVLTIAVTPALIAASPLLANRAAAIRRLARWHHGTVSDLPPDAATSDHVLIVGYGVNGRNVARVLQAVDIAYVVLEMNPETVRKARARGEPLVYGDCTRPAVLEHVGVKEARLMVVAISDPASARRAVQLSRQLNPRLYIIVRTRYIAEVEDLRRLGADAIIPEEFETSVEIFARVLNVYRVPRNLILDLIDRVRRDHYEVLRDVRLPATRVVLPLDLLSQVEIDSCLIKPESSVVGRSVVELNLRATTGAMLLAVRRGEQLLLNPGRDLHFEPGDVALLVGDRPQVDRALVVLDPTLDRETSAEESARPE